jgi:hypothetical protein
MRSGKCAGSARSPRPPEGASIVRIAKEGLEACLDLGATGLVFAEVTELVAGCQHQRSAPGHTLVGVGPGVCGLHLRRSSTSTSITRARLETRSVSYKDLMRFTNEKRLCGV